MYRKEYEITDGSIISLKLFDGGTKPKYIVKFENSSMVLYDGDGNRIEFDEDEPINVIRYLNVTLVNQEDVTNVLGTNIVKECSVDVFNSGDISFPFSNFRFKDGSRDFIYFCIINDNKTYNKDVEFPYFVSNNSKTLKCTYSFSSSINGDVDSSKFNYVLIPRMDKVLVDVTKEDIDEELYCIVALRNDANITTSEEINYLARDSSSKQFVDKFDIDGNDFYVSYNDTNNPISKIKNIKYINKLEFRFDDFINGEVNVYKMENDGETCKYVYSGTCLIQKCMPKIEVNIEKNNPSDLDYVIKDGDRSTNFYEINQTTIKKSLALLKDYEECDNGTFDIPKYDAKVSAYIPKSLIDEGYKLGQNSLKVGNEDYNIELESLNDINDETFDGYNLRTETFKVNYDNMEQDKYIYNNISSTNAIEFEDVYYIKSKENKYLDYGNHNININDDCRIVYSGS